MLGLTKSVDVSVNLWLTLIWNSHLLLGSFTSHKNNNKFNFCVHNPGTIQILFLTFSSCFPLEFSLWASRLSVLFRIIIVPFVVFPSSPYYPNSDFCVGRGVMPNLQYLWKFLTRYALHWMGFGSGTSDNNKSAKERRQYTLYCLSNRHPEPKVNISSINSIWTKIRPKCNF